MVRLALVGCGVVGRVHAKRLKADPRAEVVVCCDPRREGAAQLRDELFPAAAVETGFQSALGHKLDGVILCSPTVDHFEQACAALDLGLDVLCEKPLAVTREQIEELQARSERLGRILSVSYQRRYEAPYVTARRELRERQDRYGPVQNVHLFVCERWQQTITGTWRDDPRVGAGYFGDAGSHQVDIVNYVTGLQPTAVLATSEKAGSQVEIVTRVLARLTGGAHLTCHFVGNANHWREDIHFHCRDADLLLRQCELFRAADNKVEPIADLLPASDPDRAFLDAIETRQPTVSPVECALPMHDWTAGVLESVRTGQWVELGK